MSNSATTILSAALSLPESEQRVVLDGLLAALPAPGIWDADDPQFIQELKRRAADGSRGIPWETVQRQLGRQRE